jgi:hypothetical protein
MGKWNGCSQQERRRRACVQNREVATIPNVRGPTKPRPIRPLRFTSGVTCLPVQVTPYARSRTPGINASPLVSAII